MGSVYTQNQQIRKTRSEKQYILQCFVTNVYYYLHMQYLFKVENVQINIYTTYLYFYDSLYDNTVRLNGFGCSFILQHVTRAQNILLGFRVLTCSA